MGFGTWDLIVNAPCRARTCNLRFRRPNGKRQSLAKSALTLPTFYGNCDPLHGNSSSLVRRFEAYRQAAHKSTGLENRNASCANHEMPGVCENGEKSLSPSLPPASSGAKPSNRVILPAPDGFLQSQKDFELAEVINAWFDLPVPIVAGILAMIRAARQSL